MKFQLRNPMMLSSRIKGPNGVVRELSSIIDFNSEYCAISSWDGQALGYAEAAIPQKQLQKSHPESVPFILDFRGIERATLVTLPEVSLGTLKAENVVTAMIELGLPPRSSVDFVLGRSFLKSFKLFVNFAEGQLSIEQ